MSPHFTNIIPWTEDTKPSQPVKIGVGQHFRNEDNGAIYLLVNSGLTTTESKTHIALVNVRTGVQWNHGTVQNSSWLTQNEVYHFFKGAEWTMVKVNVLAEPI